MYESIFLSDIMEKVNLRLKEIIGQEIPSDFFVRCGVGCICGNDKVFNMLNDEYKSHITSQIGPDFEFIVQAEDVRKFNPSDSFCEIFRNLYMDILKIQNISKEHNFEYDEVVITKKDYRVLSRLSGISCGSSYEYIRLLFNAWNYIKEEKNTFKDSIELAMEYVVKLAVDHSITSFTLIPDEAFYFLDIMLKYRFKDNAEIQEYDFTKLKEVYKEVQTKLIDEYKSMKI